MSRAQTYADILLNLPVDDTLKTFMERNGLRKPSTNRMNEPLQK